jgi:hypothetical protein
MAEDNKEPSKTTTTIAPIRVGMPPPHDRQFSSTNQPAKNPGRPPGSMNKITRTMKDAAVAAAEEHPGTRLVLRGIAITISAASREF